MDPKRDMDEPVNIDLDPEDALRALLRVDPPSDPGTWDPGDDDEEPETGE